jgi:psiF repeat-containing protein
MSRPYSTVLARIVLAASLATGSFVAHAGAVADDAPPPASAPSPDNPPDGGKGRHHNPAWAACKKQADDQKLAPGDARRDFMKGCMKSANQAPPPAT